MALTVCLRQHYIGIGFEPIDLIRIPHHRFTLSTFPLCHRCTAITSLLVFLALRKFSATLHLAHSVNRATTQMHSIRHCMWVLFSLLTSCDWTGGNIARLFRRTAGCPYLRSVSLGASSHPLVRGNTGIQESNL